MKIVKFLSIALIGFFVFAGCQKELSFEQETPATGTLKDTAGNCLPITVNGNYVADSVLTDSNFVIVQVNFLTTGNYTISTDSSNGFYFRSEGSVKLTGLQSIKLTGIGRPAAAGQTDFLVAFDSSICTFSVLVTATSGVQAAVYTLAGTPDNCVNAKVAGNYEQGTALNATNQVTIDVNVDSAGLYSIIAGPVNGINFNAAGVFTSTGRQTVTLQGSGVPGIAGPVSVPVTAGNSSCNFTIDISSGGVPSADSAWQFTEGTNLYHGTIDTAFTQKVELDDADSGTVLIILGLSSPVRDSLFQINVLLPDSTIEAATTYSTQDGSAQFYLSNSRDTSIAPYYKADQDVVPAVNVQITITSYDPATKIVTGTFSGTALNTAGSTVNIAGGKIYAKVK